MNVFENLGLGHELQATIKGLGFTEPTEIQALSIPHITEGKDVIGESATGSGKTLAFGSAIAEKVMPRKGLQALILTPTRELAEQVKDVLKQLSPNLNIIAIYGGVSIGPQIDDLPRADVVVATPGRMLDHLGRRTIDTSKVNILVLDEADRMFEMGFIEDVEQIIRACPEKRQTLFFSATISSRVKELASQYMVEPTTVMAKRHVDPSKLKQVYYDVPRNMKLSLLVHLLENEKSGLVMVFCNTRRMTDFVEKNLKKNRINAIAIHGGLTQNKRNKTISMFNGAKVGVLVCTDVAARGLDIDNVSHVYNYDLPKDANDYVHRIGRTARAGEEGIVINLLCDLDHDNFSRILRDYDFNIEKLQKPYVKMVMAAKVEERRDERRSWGGRRQPQRRRFSGGQRYGRGRR
ncbi:ATP-dependent RNA helicase [Candidatus Woesearchaeota archaeon]|jgi:ATP-dependent RNA helicase DeaD|nr:ATP-dependent RNA helicase [Candidatus Woesearchaeota archaeon]|tara:strand:- start:2731 stop:3951 length:1221 start_codon:yes stop_codon:yes gene_type:complete